MVLFSRVSDRGQKPRIDLPNPESSDETREAKVDRLSLNDIAKPNGSYNQLRLKGLRRFCSIEHLGQLKKMTDVIINNDIEFRILTIFQLLLDRSGGPIHPIRTCFFDLIPFMMRYRLPSWVLFDSLYSLSRFRPGVSTSVIST
jgi:hypothetical protein